MTVDYQAVMGSEDRPFDPNQGNYTMEGFVSARLGPDTEVAGIFHHLSRHLSDRPKTFAVAYNEIGGRVMRRQTFGSTTVDLDLAGYEKRVDADPLDRLSQRWGLLGFRVLSR